MKRNDREIADISDIESIVRSASVCRLAMTDNNRPYIVPLCFGYQDNTLYFHSTREGKKLDILRKNENVCFEFDVDCEVVPGENACQWSMKYRSVIGFGKASFINDPNSKRRALDTIMRQYSNRPFDYTDAAVDAIEIIKVEVESMTGKISK